MADSRTGVYGVAFTTNVFLVSQADTKLLKANPTIASGDFKVSKDNGAFANLTTLPSVSPASGTQVVVALSATEMQCLNAGVTCIDAAGAEWCDQAINIATGVRAIDDLAFPVVSGRGMDVSTDGDVEANVTKLLGTAWLTPGVAGTPDVNAKLVNAIAAEATGGFHSPVVRGGTAQATGNTTSAIKLDSGASAANDFYKRMVVRIMSGTSAGSFGVINQYVGATKVATISGTFQNGAPDNTSVFVILDYGLGAIWDEVLSANIHNVANSPAVMLRNLSSASSFAIYTGTCQSGSTTNTVKLATTAPTSGLRGMTVVVVGAAGAQTNTIVSYDGVTKIARVANNWQTIPTNAYTYSIYAAPNSLISNQGIAAGGGAATITLADTAVATDDYYNGQFVYLQSGTGQGQTGVITDYVGATKVATVTPVWAGSQPVSGDTVYAVIPSGEQATDSVPTPPSAAEIVGTLLQTRPTPRDITAVTTPTVEDAMNAAIAGSGGDWEITAGILTLKSKDGSTFTTFTLGDFVATPATVPSSRTAE